MNFSILALASLALLSQVSAMHHIAESSLEELRDSAPAKNKMIRRLKENKKVKKGKKKGRTAAPSIQPSISDAPSGSV